MWILTAAVFFLILSILVLIHELGHFLAAKFFGIRVDEFGFGLPPRIFGKKMGETIYSLNALPIGGFVKLYGEEGEEGGAVTKKDLSRAFYLKPVWQRSIVILAGVFMNFVLAVSVISYLFTQGVMVPTTNVHIEKINTNSPAEKAHLSVGDIIKKIKTKSGEVEINSGTTLIATTREHLGEEIQLSIVRKVKDKKCPEEFPDCSVNEQEEAFFTVAIVPRKDSPTNEGPMGVAISNYELKKYPPFQAPFIGVTESLKISWEIARGIVVLLYKLITLQPVSRDIAGPVGIAQLTGQAVKFGHNAVLEFLGLLSLNLAIFNVMPIPALDGGRLLFIMIEGLTGKKIKTKYERYVHQVGMAILLALIILVTINDIIRLGTGS